MGYISPRARVSNSSIVSSTAAIYGPSAVGEGSIIGDYVVIGFPRRRGLRRLLERGLAGTEELLDGESEGSVLGRGVIVRPFTVIYEGVTIGDNVETGHFVLIREEAEIGGGSLIGTNTIVDGRVRIGSNVRIESGVYIPPETVIEDNVFIGPNATITNDRYPVSRRLVGVRIEEGAVIGANATLVAGITIGREAIVAAGSVVTKDVPPRTVVAGVPARPMASLDEYLEKRRAYESVEGG